MDMPKNRIDLSHVGLDMGNHGCGARQKLILAALCRSRATGSQLGAAAGGQPCTALAASSPICGWCRHREEHNVVVSYKSLAKLCCWHKHLLPVCCLLTVHCSAFNKQAQPLAFSPEGRMLQGRRVPCPLPACGRFHSNHTTGAQLKGKSRHCEGCRAEGRLMLELKHKSAGKKRVKLKAMVCEK